MKFPMKLPTLFIIVGMFIISLYLLIEVDYYSYSATISDSNDTPYVVIPSIGVNESINNKSIDYGVYYEPLSSLPGQGTVILFGHRTLHGSPFLNLNELQSGDNVYLEWPGIGNVEYTVSNTTIVDASYQIPLYQGNTLFLITCYPISSDTQRMIIGSKYDNTTPLQSTQSKPNSQSSDAFLIIAGLFGGGMLLSKFYPVKQDKILIVIATIALTVLLIYAYFFPVPTDGIESLLTNINNFFSL
jgi:LPXTG-site transpeptidase (sortase) family protein